MITAKQQLKVAFAAYYRRQGVGRKRIEKLVKADLCAYVRNVAASYDVPQGRVRRSMVRWATMAEANPANPVDMGGYASMFTWHRSPEGHTYWANRFGFF